MPRHALFTFPHGLALPADVSGLPEAYPFVLKNGDGTATFYTLTGGTWREAAVPNLRNVDVAAHGGASVGAVLAAHWGLAGALAGQGGVAGAVTPVFTPAGAGGLAVVNAALVARLGLSSLGPAGLGAVVAALTASSPPFTDNFNRSDRTLNGDNGWVNSTGTGTGAVAAYTISSNQVTNPATADSDPILHLRTGSGVADVSITHSFPSGGGFHGGRLYVASDLGNANSIAIRFDTSTSADPQGLIQRHVGADSNSGQWYATTTTVTNGGWVGWTFSTPMTIRMVYTEATGICDVYQNGVKKLSCDMSASNFGGTGTLPALSSMAYCGFVGRAQDVYDNLVCA